MPCLTPIHLKVYDKIADLYRTVDVPCGRCPACLSRRRAAWSYRIYHEYLSSVCAWFVTLTYDNDHLPLEGVNKDDVQKFLKRFRKKRKCRYFIVSEYGDTFGRPHYHGIFFFPEMVSLAECVHEIDASWQNGNIQVGNVTLASINYCSKYSLKPRFDEQKIFKNKTFSMMSRKPGIGASLLDDKYFVRVHKEDLDPTANLNGLTYSLPRYYQDKIFDDLDKHNINLKIQEKYGNTEKQERNAEWLWRYERAVKQCSGHSKVRRLPGRQL